MVTNLPEKTPDFVIRAILEAWDFYGPGHQPRMLGTPEAERIYQYVRKAFAAREL